MCRRWSWLLVACACLVTGTARDARAQAAAIPLGISASSSATEVVAGGTATITVALKNYSDGAVAATDPVAVKLHSDLTDDVMVTLAPGQRTAQAVLRFARPGLARIDATAPNLAGGFAVVVVKTPAPIPGAAAVAAAAPPPPAPSPAAPSPAANRAPAPVAAAAPASAGAAANIALEIAVLPQHVHPAHAQWRALVLLTAVDASNEPIAVTRDTTVYLATDSGDVTPPTSRIAAGQARTEPIQLVSSHAGTGTLWAWTDTGKLQTAQVEYHDAVPTQLMVKGSPTRAVNNGKTPITVTVFLEDDTSSAAAADRDISIDLTPSTGTASPSHLTIPKGTVYGESVLTSATSGTADVTAIAAGLQSGSVNVDFVFPWLLVVSAALGGLLGAMISTGVPTFTGNWWIRPLGHVGTGIIVGLVFYLLALFGVVASIPKVAIPLAQLPTTNELGALVLGFFGGYYARSWLPKPDTP